MGLGDTVGDGDGLTEGLPVGRGVGLGETLGLGDALALPDGRGEGLADELPLGAGDGVGVDVPEAAGFGTVFPEPPEPLHCAKPALITTAAISPNTEFFERERRLTYGRMSLAGMRYPIGFAVAPTSNTQRQYAADQSCQR